MAVLGNQQAPMLTHQFTSLQNVEAYTLSLLRLTRSWRGVQEDNLPLILGSGRQRLPITHHCPPEHHHDGIF